eukprot:COSAG02_NODE_8_length_60691_cov_104.994752_10_plen_293_part_00
MAGADSKMEVQTLLESQAAVCQEQERQPGLVGWLRAPVGLSRGGCMLLSAVMIVVVTLVAISGGQGDAALQAIGEGFGTGDERVPAFTFDDIFDGSLQPSYSVVQWISRERMVARRDGALELATPRRGASGLEWAPLVPAARYSAMNSSSWGVSHSGKYVLFASNAHALYRHSFFAEYQVLDIVTQTHIPVDPTQVQQAASWAPTETGGIVAYVMGYNIYLLDVDAGERVAVTLDGTPDGRIRNGIADWVYEEEILSGSTELFFSPDNQVRCLHWLAVLPWLLFACFRVLGR